MLGSSTKLGEVKKGVFLAWSRATQGGHAWEFGWLKEIGMIEIHD